MTLDPARLARLDRRPARLRCRARREPRARRCARHARRRRAAAVDPHARADGSDVGAGRRAAPPRAAICAREPGRGDLLDDHRRPARARARARSASTRSPPPTGPGATALWQRPLERRRARRARRCFCRSASRPWALRQPASAVLVVPVAVEPSGPLLTARRARHRRDHLRREPDKKGLDGCSRRGRRSRRDGEELLVAGVEGLPRVDGVRALGMLDRDATERCCAARGSTSPHRAARSTGSPSSRRSPTARSSYKHRAPAASRRLSSRASLDARLVGPDLAGAIRAALDEPRERLRRRARARLLERFARASVDRVVAEQLLPALSGAA